MVCYALGRKAFNELLGPIEDVWRYETLRKVRQFVLGNKKQNAVRSWGMF